MSRQNLSGLAVVGEKAVVFYHREQASAGAAADLRTAYKEFRARRAGGQHIPKGTDLHTEMRVATCIEASAFAVAKNDEQTAKRHLDGAIRAHLNGGTR